MTDRELLELAAMAAGVSADWSTDGTIQARPLFVVSVSGSMGTMPHEDEWNPLKNDGAALRLAAVLRLHILHNDPGEPVLWVSAVLNKRGIHGVVEFQDEEQRDAATRRSIVRAAAEIGRRQAAKATGRADSADGEQKGNP